VGVINSRSRVLFGIMAIPPCDFGISAKIKPKLLPRSQEAPGPHGYRTVSAITQ